MLWYAAAAHQAKQFSLLAATGVLVLQFKFWTSELLWGVQLITGVSTAQRPLLSDKGRAGGRTDS